MFCHNLEQTTYLEAKIFRSRFLEKKILLFMAETEIGAMPSWVDQDSLVPKASIFLTY